MVFNSPKDRPSLVSIEIRDDFTEPRSSVVWQYLWPDSRSVKRKGYRVPPSIMVYALPSSGVRRGRAANSSALCIEVDNLKL